MKGGNVVAMIDVIIPAYKAHKTIFKTLCSVAEQTISDELNVVIVNDCCTEGDYSEFVGIFSPYLNIKEIQTEKNSGAGVARQTGIDATSNPYFTCVDADDTLCSATALETLRRNLESSDTVKVCAGSFAQISKGCKALGHSEDMVWMFGKLYRRDFIKKYNVRFNGSRANEDTGFNAIVKMLCDNSSEQVLHIPDVVYLWHGSDDSITRINDCQYTFDQCVCGYADNMIYAIDHVRKFKPFSGVWLQWAVDCMFNLYHYYVQTVAKAPQFAEQNWEYCKKFYDRIYSNAEKQISEEVFRQMFTANAQNHWESGDLFGIIPHMDIFTFLSTIKAQGYDPDHIYEVWQKMAENPDTSELVKNNVKCGVCPDGYWKGGEHEQTCV